MPSTSNGFAALDNTTMPQKTNSFGFLTSELDRKARARRLPIAYIFVLTEAEKEHFSNMVNSGLPGANESLSVLFVDGSKYGSFASRFGLSEHVFPSVGVLEPISNRRYYLPSEEADRPELVVDFLKSVLNGTAIKVFIRSEEESEVAQLTDNVRGLTTRNYQRALSAYQGDVIVLIHADGCVHCPPLRKTFHQLAQAMSQSIMDKRPSLLFAEINAGRNDVPFHDGRVPVVKYYWLGNFDCWEEFNGDRTLESLGAFVDSMRVQTSKTLTKRSGHEQPGEQALHNTMSFDEGKGTPWPWVISCLIFFLMWIRTLITNSTDCVQDGYRTGFGTDFEPIKHMIQLERVRFQGGFHFAEDGSIFVSEDRDNDSPRYMGHSEDVDAAWRNLTAGRFLHLKGDEAYRLGQNTSLAA
ncbi:hypothetical protein CLCR_08226 [Cladophialophora carrionii]|uniref:Thioredoxin domain-containing protein n=1 Tax=Cladophialophora carrionii TaxID=86049 RepID=A0A1C1CTE7_9EURO|nr:hypothetical protein CLCR_08226 [Cladophialophora carrionii]